jgi:polar amino acid transport system substrate-binding protein
LLQLLWPCFADPVAAQEVVIPNFWDPRAIPERPDTLPTRAIRFLTDDEFPPLHFAGPDGAPTGFSVELARAACETLGITCTVQVRRFDTLLDSLAQGQGDVIASGIPVTGALRRRFIVTTSYFRTPARFAARRDGAAPVPSPRNLKGRKVAVVQGTAHEAYLKSFFPAAEAVSLPDLAAAQGALRRGEADYVFGDAMTLALWIGGAESGDCCALTGGPYLESRYFGEGIGFILRPEDENLRRAFDYALFKMHETGKYAELYLRFFPIGPF